MGIIDIFLAVVLVWGLYKGLKNGLFVELASIVALIAGLYGAMHFSYIAGDYLSKNMEWNARYINLTAFIITFIAIVVGVSFLGKFLTKVANFALLGWLNKIAGGVFGALKYAVILGALLVFFDGVNDKVGFVKEENLKSSILYTPVRDIGAFVFGKVLKRNGEANQEEPASLE